MNAEIKIIDDLIENGYIEVDKIFLPDGMYFKNGGGYEFDIMTKNDKGILDKIGIDKGLYIYDTKLGMLFKKTGVKIITSYGIRGFYNNSTFSYNNSTFSIESGNIIGLDKKDYKIFTNNKDVIRDLKLKEILEE
jgi:hypothetical protein